MRIFAIKDEERSASEPLGYLLYYEKAKAFYIELPDHIDEWDTPLLLSSFVKRGQYSINAYWSRVWVQQRIIPQDRQNLGQILKTNGLEEYDEFALLMLAKGRCAQDSYYLQEIAEKGIPYDIQNRWNSKLEDVIPLDDGQMLVFFRNGAVKKCNIKSITQGKSAFLAILRDKALYQKVELQPDGYGILWNEHLTVSDTELYNDGEDVPLTLTDFQTFVSQRVVNTAEAQALLHCSRQYVNELVQKGLLHPIREDAKNRLFMKSEIIQRLQD